jgi:hypothetical protein
MTVGFPPTGRTIPPLTADPRPRLPARATHSSPATDHADLPPAPPPEVMAEVREAARCAERLYEQGRELRFERDSRGRICAELRDLRGDVLRRLPLAEVLDVARGAEAD